MEGLLNNSSSAPWTLSRDIISSILDRHHLRARLGTIYDVSALEIVIEVDGERVVVVEPVRELSPVTLAYVSASVSIDHIFVAWVKARGPKAGLQAIADLVGLWLGDLLMLEREVASLAREVIHSYEELHLLYHLGGMLGGVLEVEAACSLIADAVLEPLGAAHATLTLVRNGSEQVVGRAAMRDDTHHLNLAARAEAHLHVNGELIGILAVQGKRGGPDFTSGDLKLLNGVAAVSAPALRNAQLYEVARRQAETDSLTGVYNHRRIQESLDESLEWSRRYGTPLSAMIVEIDELNLFSDLYGISAGNTILRLVADCLRDAVRPGDTIGSYGEDKFIVIMPDTDTQNAVAVARHILAAIRAREIIVESARLAVRVSLGVASFPEDGSGKQTLISAAASAVREAHASGGATVRCAGDFTGDQHGVDSETFSVLQGLVQAVDAKDHYTQEHSEVVTSAALLLAQRLDLPDEMQLALRIAGMLHDVGKIGIPDSVLKKPGRLTQHEFTIMKQHVVLSEVIVKGVPQPPGVLDAVAYHHERFDGNGYPYGKRGEEIPLLGRIMGVADAYSAMCIDRPYRKGLSWAEIRAELERGAGTQFDPQLVHSFIEGVEALRGSEQSWSIESDYLHSLGLRFERNIHSEDNTSYIVSKHRPRH